MRAMRRGTYCQFKLFVAIVVLMINLKELCAKATSEANANATFGGLLGAATEICLRQRFRLTPSFHRA